MSKNKLKQPLLDEIEGSEGRTPDVTGRGYKWSQLPDLNRGIFEQYKHIHCDEAKDLFTAAFEKYSNLFRPYMNKRRSRQCANSG